MWGLGVFRVVRVQGVFGLCFSEFLGLGFFSFVFLGFTVSRFYGLFRVLGFQGLGCFGV